MLVGLLALIMHAFVSCLIRESLHFCSFALTGESFLHLHFAYNYVERVLTEVDKLLQGVLRYYDESCQKPTKMAFCGDDGEPDIFLWYCTINICTVSIWAQSKVANKN